MSSDISMILQVLRRQGLPQGSSQGSPPPSSPSEQGHPGAAKDSRPESSAHTDTRWQETEEPQQVSLSMERMHWISLVIIHRSYFVVRFLQILAVCNVGGRLRGAKEEIEAKHAKSNSCRSCTGTILIIVPFTQHHT